MHGRKSADASLTLTVIQFPALPPRHNIHATLVHVWPTNFNVCRFHCPIYHLTVVMGKRRVKHSGGWGGIEQGEGGGGHSIEI